MTSPTQRRHEELVALLAEIRDRLPERPTLHTLEGVAAEFGVDLSDAEPAPADEEDERIGAWHRVAGHPFFRGCYAQERPLIDAMLDSLTLAATAAEAVHNHGRPTQGRGLDCLERQDGHGHMRGMCMASAPADDGLAEWERELFRPAPADEDPDEALAVVIDELVDDHGSTSEWADNEYITRSTALAIARAAREHLNPDGIDWESTLSGVVQDRDAAIDRAEKAEDKVQRLEASVAAWKSEVVKSARRQAVAMAERDEFNGFWKDALADVRKARDERDGWKAKHEALREDVEACRNACQIEDILDRDDERAAAIEAGESDAEC